MATVLARVPFELPIGRSVVALWHRHIGREFYCFENSRLPCQCLECAQVPFDTQQSVLHNRLPWQNAVHGDNRSFNRTVQLSGRKK